MDNSDRALALEKLLRSEVQVHGFFQSDMESLIDTQTFLLVRGHVETHSDFHWHCGRQTQHAVSGHSVLVRVDVPVAPVHVSPLVFFDVKNPVCVVRIRNVASVEVGVSRSLATHGVTVSRIRTTEPAHDPELAVLDRILNGLHAVNGAASVHGVPVAVEHLDHFDVSHGAEHLPVRRIRSVRFEHLGLHGSKIPTLAVGDSPVDLVEKDTTVVLQRPRPVYEQTLVDGFGRSEFPGDATVKNVGRFFPARTAVSAARDLGQQIGKILDGLRTDGFVNLPPSDPCPGA